MPNEIASPAPSQPPRQAGPPIVRQPEPIRPVVVVDVRVRFWTLVWFLVKLAFASIPAMLLICLIGMAIAVAVGGTGGLLRGLLR